MKVNKPAIIFSGMIVLLLVLVLAGIFEPLMGHKPSKSLVTESKLSGLGKACRIYYQYYGVAPKSLEQMDVTNPESICYIRFDTNYGNILMDSWSNPILIRYGKDTQWIEIISYGADGRPGGSGRGLGEDIIQTQHLDSGAKGMVREPKEPMGSEEPMGSGAADKAAIQ